VTAGTPISTVGMTEKDLPKLKDMARAQIENLLKQLEPIHGKK
jgi:hypothetical protein